jgi:hypothetical protein
MTYQAALQKIEQAAEQWENVWLMWWVSTNVYPHLSGKYNLVAIHFEQVDRDFSGWCEGHHV